MKSVNLTNHTRVLNRRLTGTAILLVLSVAANAGMATALATMKQTILVPSLTDTVEVSAMGGVDRDYLERLSRDATYLFLNRTPESARYFERNLERITEPETYAEIKAGLIADRLERQQSRTAQVFFPMEFFVDPSKLYVEVTGDLQTTRGENVLSNERASYAIEFSRHGSLVLLKSFVPLKKDEARGARSAISNKDEKL